MTVGGPLVAHVPSASCAANQSGSIQSSATHSAGVAAAAAAGVGGGTWPVVKSYPHFSQNNASGRFSSAQFGQVSGGGGGAGGGVSNDNDDAGGAGEFVAGALIGAPHTSQKSAVADVWPFGH